MRANKMGLNWGYYCLLLAIMLCLIQYCIALMPQLDTMVKVGILRTHHVFEILGFFFLGLYVSKSAKSAILSQVIVWTVFLVEVAVAVTLIATSWSSDLTRLTLMLNSPMFVSFYSYKIYAGRHRIREFGESEKVDKAVPVLGLVLFQLVVQGAISLIAVEPSMLVSFARAIIFLNWLIVLFTTVFLSLTEIC